MCTKNKKKVESNIENHLQFHHLQRQSRETSSEFHRRQNPLVDRRDDTKWPYLMVQFHPREGKIPGRDGQSIGTDDPFSVDHGFSIWER